MACISYKTTYEYKLYFQPFLEHVPKQRQTFLRILQTGKSMFHYRCLQQKCRDSLDQMKFLEHPLQVATQMSAFHKCLMQCTI
jgi:hypothetical protein